MMAAAVAFGITALAGAAPAQDKGTTGIAMPTKSSARWIADAQGCFVAYSKIPSFIVTLTGMLIFRGLTGNMLLGLFVGPFAKGFQAINAGFIPDFSDLGILQAEDGQDQFIGAR